MERRANLLVTTRRGDEEALCSEVWHLMREIGDEKAIVKRTPLRGIVQVITSIDPVAAVEKLRALLRKDPTLFRYSVRFIPIQRVIRADLDEMERAGAELCGMIGVDERFRVTLEKRMTELSSSDIIDCVARHIDRKVDLESPDKVVLVEIIGRWCGLSVIRPDGILNVPRELTGV
ncbi:TPA: RNA methyltransferase [Candidatus Bathyarchaeota archaeon]|nr:RNA methyltransferase [Candidatus Bathyarchaeota archaeon]